MIFNKHTIQLFAIHIKSFALPVFTVKYCQFPHCLTEHFHCLLFDICIMTIVPVFWILSFGLLFCSVYLVRLFLALLNSCLPQRLRLFASPFVWNYLLCLFNKLPKHGF